MSTSTPASSSPRRGPTRGIVITIIIAVVVVAILVVGYFVFHPWTANSDHATHQVTSSASSTPGATKSPDANGSHDPKWVKEPADLGSWKYPKRYITLLGEAGFNKKADTNTINGQKIPVMRIGATLPDDGKSVDPTTWPDSTGPALIYNSAKGVVVQTLIYADDCAMYAVGMQNVPSLHANQAWLTAHFPTDPAGINNWAAKAVWGSDEEKLAAAKACALVGALWEQQTDLGVADNVTTSLNYHVHVVAINPFKPFEITPNFELNPVQYVGKFVVLGEFNKGQPAVCEDEMLVNTGDGRFARPYCPPPVSVGCGSSCGTTVICVFGRNADGQCIPPKNGDLSQTHGKDNKSTDDGLKSQDNVQTHLPDGDTTDESAKSNGVVTDNG